MRALTDFFTSAVKLEILIVLYKNPIVTAEIFLI